MKNNLLDMLRVFGYPKLRALAFIVVTIYFFMIMIPTFNGYISAKSYTNEFEELLYDEQIKKEINTELIEKYSKNATSWKGKATREWKKLSGFTPFIIFYLIFTIAILVDSIFIHGGKRIIFKDEDADNGESDAP